MMTVIPGERSAGTQGRLDERQLCADKLGMRDHSYFVYILASQRNGMLYTGVTNDLVRRVGGHRDGKAEGFTKMHAVTMLVWCEQHQYVNDANLHEKRIKRWHRKWKLELIEKTNPQWRDLYLDLVRDWDPTQDLKQV